MLSWRWLRPIVAVVLVLGAQSPLRAADLDKFLPTDTEVFVRINLRQALDSPLIKNLGLDQLKELIKQADGLDEALKELDFDLFRDLDTLTLLLGMMILVANLSLSGFLVMAGGWVMRRAHRPLALLAAVTAIAGVFSAFLVNDAVCLVLAPLVT